MRETLKCKMVRVNAAAHISVAAAKLYEFGFELLPYPLYYSDWARVTSFDLKI